MLLKEIKLWVGFSCWREMRRVEHYAFDVLSVLKEFPTAYSFGVWEGNQTRSHTFRGSLF